MSQTGKQFKDLMSITCCKSIKNQFGKDKHNYNKAPESLTAFMLVPIPYQEQSSKSVSTHFKKISSIIMKESRILLPSLQDTI